MGFFKAVFGLLSPELRVQQTVENFVGYYRASSGAAQPPCITRYDTFMALTNVAFRPEFRRPPVVNNVCSLYSCLTPPNSAVALAHQCNILLEAARYTNLCSRNAEEFRILMWDLLNEDGQLEASILAERFQTINGGETVMHPRNEVVFGISPETIYVFQFINQGGAIWQVLQRGRND